LVIHRSHVIPSFEAFALGEVMEIMASVRDTPEVLLPRLDEENDRPAWIFVRQRLELTAEDVTRVVRALTGITVREEHLIRADLLANFLP